MNRVLGTTALAVCLLGMTTQALATPPSRHRYDDDRYYRTEREVPPVGYEYAEVVDVDPIVRQVRVEVPRKECFSEVQPVYHDRPIGPGPALVGGLIGGVIGNQVGHGHGRHLATAAGALIGASIASNTAARRARYASEPDEQVVERCDVRYEQQYEERTEGYRVRYLYNGREYSTQLPYDPGERIKIRVAVEPAE